MIVSGQDFDRVVEKLCEEGLYGLDTETTGLREDDSLFAIIVASDAGEYYFNFNPYPAIDGNLILPRSRIKDLRPIFANPRSLWFIHNAKFDMRMLAKEGLAIAGEVHCTYAIERVIHNNYLGEGGYRLAGCAARRGWAKDSQVEAYVEKHKCYTKVSVPGKKKIQKLLHFEQVPLEVMLPYGTQDGKLHLDIGKSQIDQLLELSKNSNYPSLAPLYKNEVQLTKTCFQMERTGIQIDRPFTALALEYEMGEIRKHINEFQEKTGRVYQDSNKLFKEIFDSLGESYPRTEKGNASFAGDALEAMESPVASIINNIRYHEKRAGTYYSSFLHAATSLSRIHPDMRQAGTETGRFSYRDPNLQNVPKEDRPEDQTLPFHVRECFTPTAGHSFYALDYRQMEYRMMLDYAGEKKLIADVMDGADVHQATADIVGISRTRAKTLNFAILYGAGVEKIAKMLGVSKKEAKDLKITYFEKLPKVHRFIRQVTDQGAARGFVYNWFGRRCHIDDSQWAYVLPNHLIQGGCSDVVKIAMNAVDSCGGMEDARMILQVHDELLFEVPFGQEAVMSGVAGMMESVYKPQNGMKLTTSMSRSSKHWGFRNMEEVDDKDRPAQKSNVHRDTDVHGQGHGEIPYTPGIH